MFERFTDRAREVVAGAQREALALDHGYIGTEHVLLGLLADDESFAGRALTSLGITHDSVQADVLEIVGRGEGQVPGRIPFTPRAKKVLELSLREALQHGHNYIGTEHILLGIVAEGEGIAAQVLVQRAGDLDEVRRAVEVLMPGGPPPRRGSRWSLRGRSRGAQELVGGPRVQHCSFCGRPQPVVAVLLSGVGDARICDHCVARAADLIEQARSLPDEPTDPGPQPPSGEA